MNERTISIVSAETEQRLLTDIKHQLPRIAKLLNEPVENVAILATDYWPQDYMYTSYRDRPIHVEGPLEGVPFIHFIRRHEPQPMVGYGLTLYECRSQPDLKYVSWTLRARSDGDEDLLFVAKNKVYRLKRHAFRMNKEASYVKQAPILADGVLDEIIRNTVGFLLEAKQIEKYGVKIKRGIILDGPPGNGKAQPLSSLVMTPDGPMRMGDIKPGHTVCTPDGGIARVLGTFPQGKIDIYSVHFSDGTQAECCLDHLWKVESRNGYKSGVLSTAYLKTRLKTKQGKRIYSISLTQPVKFREREHALHPYLIGVLLGDGGFSRRHVRVTVCENQIKSQFEELLPPGYSLKNPESAAPCDYDVTRDSYEQPAVLTQELRRLRLMGLTSDKKFIPTEYLYDSVENRLALLQGLMDTDGTVHADGGVSLTTTSHQLAVGLQTLVNSLGGKCAISEVQKTYTYKGERRLGKLAHYCFISFAKVAEIFTLERKKARLKPKQKYLPKRLIESIEFVRQDEAQCILIDHPDHLYLTDNFVVTHNTMACRYIRKLCDQHSISWSSVGSAEIDDAYEHKNLNELFVSDTVTFFDDIDVAYLDRTKGNGKMACSLLTAMDGMSETGHLVRIFTTNEPVAELDPAFTRPGRIDKCITLNKPDEKLRRRLVETVWPTEIQEAIDIEHLIKRSQDFSFAEVEAIRTSLVTNKILGDGTWDLEKAFEEFESSKADKMRQPKAKMGFLEKNKKPQAP